MSKKIIVILTLFFSLYSPLLAYKSSSLIVYKTRNDYRFLMSLQLADDRVTIISLPVKEKLVNLHEESFLPVPLLNNYYLDQVGLSPRSVFLDLTYQDYAQLEKTPSLNEFLSLIIDFQPFVEFYYCPDNLTVAELNNLIAQHQLKQSCELVIINERSTIKQVEVKSTTLFWPWFLIIVIGVGVLIVIRRENRKAVKI